MDQYELIRMKLKYAKHIVFFGGAGVSTASGIKDFRSQDGIYNIQSKYGVPYEIMLSHTYFEEHPETFFDFYKSTMVNKKAKPNAAHIALAEYEKKHHNLTIITQNIDNLHQMAGSQNVLELHGSVYRNYCEECHESYTLDDIMKMKGVPTCGCGGIIKPDVVLYEEPLDTYTMARAALACAEADVMIVGGTSLKVYPAANFVHQFHGDTLIIINNEHTPADEKADYFLQGNIAEILPKILN